VNSIKAFIRLEFKDKLLLLEAISFLFIAKGLLLLPFKFSLMAIKTKAYLNSQADLITLHRVRDAVSRANKLAIWKNICLTKSIAARFMLQRRHISSTMYLGLQFKNSKELSAHAWLVSGEIQITPKGSQHYHEIIRIK
jgi:hypothetical protein